MRKQLVLTALAVVLGAAFAAPSFAESPELRSLEAAPNKPYKKEGRKGHAMFKKHDLNGDGVISKEEFLKVHEEKFGHMDQDNDGAISKEEAKDAKAKRHEKMQERREEMKEHRGEVKQHRMQMKEKMKAKRQGALEGAAGE